jgi:hypothetical protein
LPRICARQTGIVALGHSVETVTAYNDLNGFQFRTGKGYEKRSVEQFKAISLTAVDELLREVTQLRDELAGVSHSATPVRSEPTLNPEEASLLARFRSANADVRQLMLLGQPPSSVAPPAFVPSIGAPASFGSASGAPVLPPEPMAAAFGTELPPVDVGQPSWAIETDWAGTESAAIAAQPSDTPTASEIGFPLPAHHSDAPAPIMAFEPVIAVAPDADEPEWLRSLSDEPAPVAPASSNWFLDDAFEGDVPNEARGTFATTMPGASSEPSTPLGNISPPAADPWSVELEPMTPSPSAGSGLPSPSWTPEPPTSDAPPAPAWQAPPSVWDAPAPEVAVEQPTATAAFEAVPRFMPVPDLDTPEGDRQIDDLFNQLDFGPPPAGVLAIASSPMTSVGAEVTPFAPASPLHVERPSESPGPLPAPTPPWSGWIQS